MSPHHARLGLEVQASSRPPTAPTFNGRADGANGVVIAGAGGVAGADGAGAVLVRPVGLMVVWLRSWGHSFLAWCIGGDPSNHTSPPGVRCERRGSSGGNQ